MSKKKEIKLTPKDKRFVTLEKDKKQTIYPIKKGNKAPKDG